MKAKQLFLFFVIYISTVSSAFAVTFDTRYSCYAHTFSGINKDITYGDCAFALNGGAVLDDCPTATISTSFQLTNENGNILNPLSYNQLSAGSSLLVHTTSIGEYYDCGGPVSSPPIAFTPEQGKQFYYSPNYEAGFCGHLYTQMVCNTTTTVKVTNSVTNEVKTYTSKNTTADIPIGSLMPGNYNVDLSRAYACSYGGFGISSSTPVFSYAGGNKTEEGMSIYYWCLNAEYSPPKTVSDSQSFSIIVSGKNCNADSSCESGFTCCSGYCYGKSTGICADLMGNGIKVWVPYNR